jgi:hypothetical protein
MATIDLEIETRGRVSGGAKSEVVNTLKDCFRHFGSKVPYKIEVLITDTEAMMRDYLRQEKFKTGIIEDTVEDTICLYDIWKGYPRITISMEKLEKFGKAARQGLIRHQAAHTALHASMEFRIFKIPDDCKQTAMIKGIETVVLEEAMRKLSLAVKDCEATRLLVENNYINCQMSFAIEWIQPQEEPRTPPKPMVRTDRQQKFISQIMLLKPILFTHPLMSLEPSKKVDLEKQVMLGRRIEELIHPLMPHEQQRLLQVANLIADNLTEDSHANMDSALHHAMALV